MATDENVKIEADTNMLEASFNFWFTDNEHIRSPFPDYTKEDILQQSTARFNRWVENISDKAQKEINDEILVEKLEEFIFEIGLSLVKTEDEKITIQYPFLPRVNDVITIKDESKPIGESKVTEREIIKRGDESFLKIKLLSLELNETWETEFELPK